MSAVSSGLIAVKRAARHVVVFFTFIRQQHHGYRDIRVCRSDWHGVYQCVMHGYPPLCEAAVQLVIHPAELRQTDSARPAYIGTHGVPRACARGLPQLEGYLFHSPFAEKRADVVSPPSSGCYCKVNSYLKEVIGLLANSFDYVVIDGEAGIEQIQRRVMEKVTHLLLVTDQSKKGAQVVSTIKNVADELIAYDRIGVIVNRVTNPELADLITVPGVEILSFIPADSAFAANDIKGKSVLELPADSAVLTGVKDALQKIEIL